MRWSSTSPSDASPEAVAERIKPIGNVTLAGSEPAPAAAEQPQVAAPASADSYLLQAGAFSQRADAERLRASLALLGVEAEIQAGQGSDRQRVFRVRSGPYPSRAAVERARANLKRNGINSIAIKQGG